MIRTIVLCATIVGYVSAALKCGKGTIEIDGACEIASTNVRELDRTPRVISKNDGIEFKIGGATLRLENPEINPTLMNEQGKVLCSGSNVEVNTDNQCVPKIEMLRVDDVDIPLGDLITNKEVSTKLTTMKSELQAEMTARINNLESSTMKNLSSVSQDLQSLETVINNNIGKRIATVETAINDLKTDTKWVEPTITRVASTLDGARQKTMLANVNKVNQTLSASVLTISAMNITIKKLLCAVEGRGYDAKTDKCTYPTGVLSLEESCSAYKKKNRKTGIEIIEFDGVERYVYCEQDRDGGGWLLVARIASYSRKHMMRTDYLTSSYDPFTNAASDLSGTATTSAARGGCLSPTSKRPCKLSDGLINAYKTGKNPSNNANGNAYKFKCQVSAPHNRDQYFRKECKFQAQMGVNQLSSAQQQYCGNRAKSWQSTSWGTNSCRNQHDCAIGGHCGSDDDASYGWHACQGDAGYASYSEVVGENEDVKNKCSLASSKCQGYTRGCGHNSYSSGDGRDGYLYIR